MTTRKKKTEQEEVGGFVVRTARLVPASEYSPPFIQGMVDRMSVSFFKHGLVAKAFPEHVDALKTLVGCLEKYQKTKNTEYLIDAANYAMIEFMRPSVPGATFTPTDSKASAGRHSKATGQTSWKDNASI